MKLPEGLEKRLAPAKERAESFLKTFEWTWTKAVIFSVAFAFAILISMGVIPSFWLYFANQKLQWDGAAAHKLLGLPITISGFWLKEIRDAVAMGLSTGPLVTFIVAAVILQNWRRKLRGATGDVRPSGGYR